jgi:biotin transport system ATP-binding protein
MSIIEIRNLTHRFSNAHTGVFGIDLTIEKGDFIVIAGSNGSGKTTLLRHLNGLLVAQEGTVRVDGMDVRRNVRRVRQIVGMVFQDADSQIVGETVRDDVTFGPENLCWSPERVKSAVDQALDLLNLSHVEDQSPHLLSGGEKRRLAIAGVLAMQPEVLVLDEPFANLDYFGVRDTLSHIVKLHAMGCTIVLTAHDLEKVVAHARRLVVLHRGRIVADDIPATILPDIEPYGIRMPCAVRMGAPLVSWLD